MSGDPGTFRPVQAVARRLPPGAGDAHHVVAMTDRDGRLLMIDMPNLEGAQFVAAAIQNEMTQARREDPQQAPAAECGVADASRGKKSEEAVLQIIR